jgi:putative oxidoreductase
MTSTMSLPRVVARPLLSSMFVYGGLDALRHPEGKVKVAEPVAGPIAERIPHLTTDTETLVRMNGAVMVGAGTLLAMGKFRRLASVALIASLLPTTYAGHRFWEESDDVSRAQQRIHFLKNMGLLGGLILAALDTEGEPSWSWRAKETAHRAQRKAHQVKGRAHQVKGRAHRARGAARRAQQAASGRLGEATSAAPAQARKRLVGFSRLSEQSAKRAARAAAEASQRASRTAQPIVSGGVQRAGQVWADVAEHLPVS